MDSFEIGDFVRLKNFKPSNSMRDINIINIFQIDRIERGYFCLQMYKRKVRRNEIEPIPINGIDDKELYYEPNFTDASLKAGELGLSHDPDNSYYLDHIQRLRFQNNTLREILKERNIVFVHQLQHFLSDMFSFDELKIINY